jgi:hypothetical protein
MQDWFAFNDKFKSLYIAAPRFTRSLGPATAVPEMKKNAKIKRMHT